MGISGLEICTIKGHNTDSDTWGTVEAEVPFLPDMCHNAFKEFGSAVRTASFRTKESEGQIGAGQNVVSMMIDIFGYWEGKAYTWK